MLSPAQIEELRKKLEKAKKNIEGQLLKFAQKDNQVKGNYRSKFPDIGNQQDENAQEVQEYELNISLEHSFEEELQSINKALDRIEKKKYGMCSCGKPISYGRLSVRPQAVMCIECKSKKEKNN